MEKCSICLEESSKEKEEYKLSCNHIYHKACIQEWLSNHTTCPLCRAHVDPIQQYVDDDVVSPERMFDIRHEIDRMKLWAELGGFGVEILGEVLFPNKMKGFGSHLSRKLNRGHFDESYGSVARTTGEGGGNWFFVAVSVILTAVCYHFRSN